MGIKIIITLQVLLMTMFSYGQTEEQLKFSVEAPEAFKDFIMSSPIIGELNSYYHSENKYSDIYLDTEEQILLKNNFSLRFRKRVFDDSLNTITYSMQLKNEMTTSTSIRMEIEEPELDFYSIFYDGNKTSLVVFLETIFNHYEKTPLAPLSKNEKVAIDVIEKWIKDKASAPIGPFQKLCSLQDIGLSEIKNLKLVTCGSSIRFRSHTYASKEASERLNIPMNKIKINSIPPYFMEHTTDNWLLETSFDLSTFYNVSDSATKRVNLVEYEVEQKHYDPTISKVIFEIFEQQLGQQYTITPKFDSKYKQMQLQFSVK